MTVLKIEAERAEEGWEVRKEDRKIWASRESREGRKSWEVNKRAEKDEKRFKNAKKGSYLTTLFLRSSRLDYVDPHFSPVSAIWAFSAFGVLGFWYCWLSGIWGSGISV